MPPAVTRRPARTAVRGRGWSKRSTVDADKFDRVADAIRDTLATEPIRFSELTRRVEAKLRGFEGSVPWYTLTCLRELEVRGEVTRQVRPALYSRKSPTVRA